MAKYWCESCPSRSFKNFRQLIKHLREIHKIPVYRKGEFYRDESQKRYFHVAANFFVDGERFARVPDLLRYVDRKYGIHCCYVKGLVKPVVFLDGATREEK